MTHSHNHLAKVTLYAVLLLLFLPSAGLLLAPAEGG